MEAFNFGQGVENQLKDDGDPNEPVDPDLVNAIKECYHSNPAKRKCNMCGVSRKFSVKECPGTTTGVCPPCPPGKDKSAPRQAANNEANNGKKNSK